MRISCISCEQFVFEGTQPPASFPADAGLFFFIFKHMDTLFTVVQRLSTKREKIGGSLVFPLFPFTKGVADYSRKHVYFPSKDHKASDPRYHRSAHPAGQRQAEGLCSARPTI